jgi:signal peptidase
MEMGVACIVTKLISRLCNGLGTAILLLIILCAGGLLLSQFLGWQPMGILSGSMEPSYHVGGLVFIDTKAAPEDIAPGDVVAFYIGDDTVVTHRVVAVDREAGTFTTQGDANNAVDAPTAFDRMIGRAGRHVPLAGYALMNLKTVKGFAVGAIMVAVLILLFVIPMLLAPAKEPSGPRHARRGRNGYIAPSDAITAAWAEADPAGADPVKTGAAGRIAPETEKAAAENGDAGTTTAPETEGVSPEGFVPRRENRYRSNNANPE